MTPNATKFLLWSFLFSCPMFVLAVLLERSPYGKGEGPLAYLLLLLGCLGPVIGGILSGGLASDHRKRVPGKGWLTAPALLVLNFAALALSGTLQVREQSKLEVLAALPFAALLGAQEIGWRGVLQPALERTRKLWKATAATGLITALWYLPMMFCTRFPVKPELYLNFAVLLMGMSFVQNLLVRRTGTPVWGGCFTAVYLLLMLLWFPFEQGGAYYGAAALLILLTFLYQSRLIKENCNAE